MRSIQLVIPAAGLGSRFASIGIKTPKPLIRVLGLPMIAWVIGNFQLTSSDKVIIVTRPELGIEEELGPFVRGLKCSVKFVYIDQVTEGPAISVSLAKSLLEMDKALVVANSDQFVSGNLEEFMNEVRASNTQGCILTMNASGNKWSYVNRNESSRIVEVKEKIEISHEATVGIYGWSKAEYFFESLDLMIFENDRTNGEFYVAPSYNYLVQNGMEISGVNIGNIENQVHGLGTPEDLDLFNKQPNQFDYFDLVMKNLSLKELRNE